MLLKACQISSLMRYSGKSIRSLTVNSITEGTLIIYTNNINNNSPWLTLKGVIKTNLNRRNQRQMLHLQRTNWSRISHCSILCRPIPYLSAAVLRGLINSMSASHWAEATRSLCIATCSFSGFRIADAASSARYCSCCRLLVYRVECFVLSTSCPHNAVVTTTIRRPFDCLSKVIKVTVT